MRVVHCDGRLGVSSGISEGVQDYLPQLVPDYPDFEEGAGLVPVLQLHVSHVRAVVCSCHVHQVHRPLEPRGHMGDMTVPMGIVQTNSSLLA